MKDAEDEAFDDLAKKQGVWGGGYQAKRKMAADKLWDKPSVAFDEWWNGDNDESTNPFRLESGAYWAYAGWKAALAQPAQEPVAWMTINEYGEEDDIHYQNPEGHLLEGWTYRPLYTHPPTVQPEKEPLEYWNAVEGWVKIDEVREHFDSVGCGTIYKTPGDGRVPLTTAQCTWVGLTDEEIAEIRLKSFDTIATNRTVYDAIEAKLKEKNG